MSVSQDTRNDFDRMGFAIAPDMYDKSMIDKIAVCIDATTKQKATNPNFLGGTNTFAIRRFLHELPSVAAHIFDLKIVALLQNAFGSSYFIVKSIYFDKPADSNWFVAYHQDLTISVKQKYEVNGFGSWIRKHEQFNVRPPVEVLLDNFTLRIHLDDTDSSNGALKVIPGSHKWGIARTEQIDRSETPAFTCDVAAGGIMLMSPLLMHSSARTSGNRRRRVIHIEFSRTMLPHPLEWAEKMLIPRLG